MHRLVHHHSLETPDGIALDVQQAGPTDGPTLLIVNGLGGNIYAWQSAVDALSADFHVVSWDYRGLFRSGAAPASHQTVSHHARDLALVLDHLELDDVVALSWSFGTQVALAAMGATPERFKAHVSVCGTFTDPLTTATGSPNMFARAAKFFANREDTVRTGLSALRDYPSLIRAGQRLGWLSDNLEEDVFLAWVDSFAGIDLKLYFAALQAMRDHTIAQLLGRLEIPTLFVAGGRDKIVPADAVRAAAAQYVGPSEVLTFEDATHYLPMEHPRGVADALARFVSA